MKIPIVFSTDNNYVMQTGVTILSLLESAHTSTVYEIFVLINNDVTEESKQCLRKQVSYFPNHTIDFISIGTTFENSFEIRNISIATYSRLLIPWLLPQYDKIIYSDVDIIFHTDLTNVYGIEMGHKLVAGVIAYTLRLNKRTKKYLKKIGLDIENYINAGFLIINSKLQRERGLYQQYMEEAKKKHLYQDQDIINIICKGNIIPLSKSYNLTTKDLDQLVVSPAKFKDFCKNPDFLPLSKNVKCNIENFEQAEECVIHYVGAKPWNTFTHAWKEWWNTYRRSIFYDTTKEIEMSHKILNPKITWRSIITLIKRKCGF